MDCYSCKHRGSIPGDAHSTCNHSVTKEILGSRLTLLSILANGYVSESFTELFGVKLNPAGVRGGWANWPLNFDPTWIVECSLFEEKLDGSDS